MKYRNRLVIWVIAIFIFFSFVTLFISIYNHNEDKRNLSMSLLECYADVIASSPSVEQAKKALPEDLRVTVFSPTADIISDTHAMTMFMDDHYERPEIAECMEKGESYVKRYSTTLGQKCVYYAKMFEYVIIRVSHPYDKSYVKMMRPDWSIIACMILILAVSVLSIVGISKRYKRKEIIKKERDARAIRNEMTRNISHELKTPVSSLQGYLETLVNNTEMDPEKRQLFLERAYVQALKLTDIISDISTVIKMEETPGQYQITAVNLKVVAAEVVDELGEQLRDNHISVENNVAPISIGANYNLIYAIFRNLIENTIKYSGGNCKVRIGYELLPDGMHQIDYSDTGRGVPEEELERLFDRFYRLNVDRAGGKSGSGLGLSIVRNAVLVHKGTISAYNVPEGGLGFIFTLSDLH